jgi:hypothetical protein
MKKPSGYYRKRDKHGRLKTHPVFVDEHHLHHAEHAKVYKIPQRQSKIIGFDVDGTLDIAGGTISLVDLHNLKQKGWAVAIISDATKRPKVREQFGHEADIFLSKPKAKSMKVLGKGFGKKVYVGNSHLDEKASKKACWEYVRVRDFAEKALT